MLIRILSISGFIVISVVIVLGFIRWSWHNPQKVPEHIQKIQTIEKERVSFTVYSLDEKPILLSSFIGKVVVLNFWATWCAPCVAELSALSRLATLFPNHLVVLAISNESAKEIKDFLKTFSKMHFIPARVDKKDMLKIFSVRALPETYILDHTGHLVEKIIGPKKWASDEWKNKIKMLIRRNNLSLKKDKG